jgi:secondary thiamine-phosphate synthase enzyme
MIEITVRTHARCAMIDITREVEAVVADSGVAEGLCTVFVPHTTAAVTINEGADPSVAEDIAAALSDAHPKSSHYRHAEGNADSHIKTSVVGPSVTILVEGGRLCLGTWQAVFFCEFDGPRSRKAWVRVQ